MDSHGIAIVTARDFLKNAQKPDHFKLIRKEYYSIVARRSDKMISNFVKPENQAKNRYLDIPCWDHSRVVLDAKTGGSDYIHANWIDGFEEPKKFIATQGPMANTTADFWKLVWQQCCHVIVMLTPAIVNGEEKCHQYWSPKENGSLVAGEYCIKTLRVEARTNYIRTIIKITNKSLKKSMELTHFQCFNWSEYSTPSDLSWFEHFMIMIDRVRRAYMELSFERNEACPCPVVVHCSAGVGRTGTFCAVNICVNQVVKTMNLCIPEVVFNVREQRYLGVMSCKQYSFIYQVLEDLLSAHKNVGRPSTHVSLQGSRVIKVPRNK